MLNKAEKNDDFNLELNKAMTHFSCKLDSDVEYFLKNTAKLFEKTAKARTYFLINKKKKKKKHEIDIVAYFSLALKTLIIPESTSKNKRKKIDGLNKEASEATVYLIGQLARDDSYDSNDISGKEILDSAIDLIEDVQTIVGGRIVLIECKDEEELLNFYKQNKFTILPQEETKKKLFIEDTVEKVTEIISRENVPEEIVNSIEEVMYNHCEDNDIYKAESNEDLIQLFRKI